MRGRARLRGGQHVVRNGLRAVLGVRIERVHGGQVPLFNLHADDQRGVLDLHGRSELVRRERNLLQALHCVPGRHAARRGGVHDDGRRDVHELHGGPGSGCARRHSVHNVPYDAGGRVCIARPRGPADLRMQRDRGLLLERNE